MKDCNGNPYRQKTEFTGRFSVRRNWYGRNIVTVEEVHTVLSGYLPQMTHSPSRSIGDTWFTWRDLAADDVFKMGYQIRGNQA